MIEASEYINPCLNYVFSFPLKPGLIVYEADRRNKSIKTCRVVNVIFCRDGSALAQIGEINERSIWPTFTRNIYTGDVGVSVFVTREEAEASLSIKF